MTVLSVKRNEITIAPMRPDNWAQVRQIYLEGIATGQATFEIEAPSWPVWDDWHLPMARLVALCGNRIVGWAALSPVSRRQAYAGAAEVSIYVARENRNQGIGHMLLERLISESEQYGIWTLQAVVFPENLATLALHRGCGFRDVGRRERIGKLNGVWRDTILLERRSPVVGTD